jgi:hypothetical protein
MGSFHMEDIFRAMVGPSKNGRTQSGLLDPQMIPLLGITDYHTGNISGNYPWDERFDGQSRVGLPFRFGWSFGSTRCCIPRLHCLAVLMVSRHCQTVQAIEKPVLCYIKPYRAVPALEEQAFAQPLTQSWHSGTLFPWSKPKVAWYPFFWQLRPDRRQVKVQHRSLLSDGPLK